MTRIAHEDQNLPALPSWLEELLPEKETPLKLTVAEDGKSLELISVDGTSQIFSELKDAHKVILSSDKDLFIDESVYNLFPESQGFMLTYPSEGGKGYTTLVMSHTDEDRHKSLRSSYKDSLFYIEKYEAEPNDFFNAYHLIDSHPAFWIVADLVENPWYWSQEGYMGKVHQHVWKDRHCESDPEQTMVALEAGSHVEKDSEGKPSYNSHYGDWRLEVVAKTFEEAVIALAARVVLCFNSDGTDKPEDSIDLPKPKWVVELEERLDEHDSE